MSQIESLARAVARHAATDGLHPTAIEPLYFFRASAPTGWHPVLYEPAVFLVVQGRKLVQVGAVTQPYDPAGYALASVDVPVMCRVDVASAKTPYLAVRVQLDALVVGELIDGHGAGEPPAPSEPGFAITPIESPLLEAMSRLVGLLDTPADIAVLAPLLLREIAYRVLTGAQGSRLRHRVTTGSPAQRIARAIEWIRGHAAEPLRVDSLARKAGLGVSSFHVHFKTVTGLSPLQYQKRLRLIEARRLMVSVGLTAAEAAFRVGYESPSQFSREYRRAFGAPPRQNVVTIRADAASAPV